MKIFFGFLIFVIMLSGCTPFLFNNSNTENDALPSSYQNEPFFIYATLEKIPSPQTISEVELIKFSQNNNLPDITESEFKAIIASAKPLPSDSFLLSPQRSTASTFWYSGSFKTPEGQYQFSLDFSGDYYIGKLITPGQKTGAFSFEYERASITKEEAMILAEKFILENGYTENSALILPKEKLFIEWTDDPSNIETVLRNRAGTLESGAVNAWRNQVNGGWTIAFPFTEKTIKKYQKYFFNDAKGNKIPMNLENQGRAVTMDAKGKNLNVSHQNILLDFKPEQ